MVGAMAIIRGFEGKIPDLGAGVFVADNASIIGDVVVAADSSIWFGAVLRGDVMPIRIGRRTSIQDNTVIHVTSGFSGTTVGDDVTVGHNVILHACEVEDQCIIGMGSIILDGARIGRGSIVGAGALVTPGTIIPPGSQVLGAPAKVRRATNEQDKLWISGSAAHYVELARRYLAAG